jgi:hypothetical protein
MKTYRVIAQRVSYEELFIQAASESDAIALITMGDKEYEWDDLSKIDWQIDSIEEAAE